MTETVLIGVAWPYANGSLHLGQIAGAYLPGDIFARYHRIKGNRALMVSGSDQHGTPITVRAEQEGKPPADIAARFHQEFLRSWEQLGISFDLFTSTGTENHAATVHDIFLTLLNKGYIYDASMSMPYCEFDRRHLPDRYVEGTCPYCGFTGARGDQCDNCGRTLNPEELIDWRCRLCKQPPVPRETWHFFLKLGAFGEELARWVEKQGHWRSNVRNFTLGMLSEGLKDRAITRDIDWGVKIPLPGYDDKRIYVWFEAVIGYLSASIEWAKRQGEPERWRDFWTGDSRSYYFLGKDNITFHTIIWPAMLMGCGGLNLPYDVPANQYLTMSGSKVSTSRNWAIWLPDYLERYDPDPLRYYLSANMPETSDSDFTWEAFFARNNNELVATYGNLANRVLTFTYRNFEGMVPERGTPDERDRELLAQAEAAFEGVGQNIAGCRFRDALRVAMALAQESNRYLDEKEPWKAIKQRRDEAATSLNVAVAAISALCKLLYPFLPFSSQKLYGFLGFEGPVGESGWRFDPPTPGQRLKQPAPLFKKLDEKMLEEEVRRLSQA